MTERKLCADCEEPAIILMLVGPAWKRRTPVYCCQEHALIIERECAGVLDSETILLEAEEA